MSSPGLALCGPGFAGWGDSEAPPSTPGLGHCGDHSGRELSLCWTRGQAGRNPGVILK